ncbi:MAG: GlcG/HbpS family heme-binding protein [Acidimicrobiales bacterium]
MTLTRKEARILIDAAADKADELGQKPAIAVVDATSRVVSVDQLDGARLHRDRMAKGKALAAIVLGQNTHDALEMQQTRPTRYHGLIGMFPGEIYISGGGVLLEVDGEIVGAIGIAGGKDGSDEKMAEAGIAAWRVARRQTGGVRTPRP